MPSSLCQAPVQNDMEDSYLSTSSFDQNPSQVVLPGMHDQVFKSQGIKQLLSHVPANSVGLTTTQFEALLSKPSSISTQADLLIEQSKKRIQDITELMKPPATKVGSTSFD